MKSPLALLAGLTAVLTVGAAGSAQTCWTERVLNTSAFMVEAAVAGDFDGDGDEDVLGGSSAFGDGLAWYENVLGDGSVWRTHPIAPSAPSVEYVAAADVDGDGDVDALASMGVLGAVRWFENVAGDGSEWTNRLITNLPLDTGTVVGLDVDGDGDMDVLTVQDDDVAWYENNAGDGSTWTIHVIPLSCGTGSATGSDVDGDGDADVVATCSSSSTVAWYENTAGDGTSWTRHVITTAAGGASWAVGVDIDGDGDTDALSAAQTDDTVAWHENLTGDGLTWSTHVISTSQDTVEQVSAADMDGDGDLDAVAAVFFDDDLAWFENAAGDGSVWVEHVISTSTSFVSTVSVGDFDDDGSMDVLTADGSLDTIQWHENVSGDGSTWSPRVVTTTTTSPSDVYAADLDGDGDQDALTCSATANKIAWYENVDGFGFLWATHHISVETDFAFEITAGDVDGDGDNDVVAANGDDGTVAWYENVAGDGNSWTHHAITATRGYSVFLADMDGDGAMDVLSASDPGNEVVWYENSAGDGSAWIPHVISASVLAAESVFAADVDGDGDLDAFSGGSVTGNHEVLWHENTAGDGSSWSLHTIATSGNGIGPIFAGDVDGDGDFDLVYSVFFHNSLLWQENTAGDGSAWTSHFIASFLEDATDAFGADADGNGTLDVLASSRSDDTVTWYLNTAGDGSSWTTEVVSRTADGAVDVFAADVDGDGDVDPLCASNIDNEIAWYRNGSADQASATFRNAGANPASYAVNSLPLLGGTFEGAVDVGGTTGHAFAVLLGYATPITFPLADGQVLLLNIGDPGGELLAQTLVAGPVAVFQIAVPDDPALCGFSPSTQAIHIVGPQPFALSNAQDLVLGY